MRAILKLRWMKLRDEIKLVGFMTALTFVMIAVFASVNYTDEVIEFGYVDTDQSVISENLYNTLNKIDGYQFNMMTLEEAEEAVKSNDVSGAFYVKEGFMADVLTGQVTIERMLISENMNNLQMNNLINSTLGRVMQDYQLSMMIQGVVNQFGTADDALTLVIQDTIDEHWTYKKPISVSNTALKSDNPYSAIKHSIIGFSLFFSMFTIIFGISDILVEKEQNTWQRQLVSPISKISILSGNLIATFALGFVQVSSMFLVSKYLFKVDWAGNMLHLVMIIAAFVFCVSAIGMMLSNFVNTIGQLSAISPVLITGTAMLGGCFWPLEIVTSKVLLFLSLLTPQRWAIEAIKKVVVHGYPLNDVLFNISILLGMGIVYLLIGTYVLEKKSV